MTREEAIKHLSEWMDEKMWRCFGTIDREAIGVAIEALSADRPIAEWIEVCDTSRICSITRLKCSKCDEEWLPERTSRFNYCPCCGALMLKGDD